jgi:hypothetical protein
MRLALAFDESTETCCTFSDFSLISASVIQPVIGSILSNGGDIRY